VDAPTRPAGKASDLASLASIPALLSPPTLPPNEALELGLPTAAPVVSEEGRKRRPSSLSGGKERSNVLQTKEGRTKEQRKRLQARERRNDDDENVRGERRERYRQPRERRKRGDDDDDDAS